jgi:hypothetical protein
LHIRRGIGLQNQVEKILCSGQVVGYKIGSGQFQTSTFSQYSIRGSRGDSLQGEDGIVGSSRFECRKTVKKVKLSIAFPFITVGFAQVEGLLKLPGID